MHFRRLSASFATGLGSFFVAATMLCVSASASGPVTIRVEPASSNGPCPALFTFKAVINARGLAPQNPPKSVTYHWIRSDGAIDTRPVTTTPNSDGFIQAQTTWTLSPPHYDGWEALQITSPVSMTSDEAHFTLSCSGGAPPTATPSAAPTEPSRNPGQMPRACEVGRNNLLKNGLFSTGGPATSFTGVAQETGAAAPEWAIWTNVQATTTTNWLSSFAGRSGVIHVTTTAERNGLEQVYASPNTGPAHSKLWIWVYVERGEVGIGSGNGGGIGIQVTTSAAKHWVLLEAPNGSSPSTQMLIYSNTTSGADFYVDSACVLPVGT